MTTENGRQAAGGDTAERCFDSGFQGGSDCGVYPAVYDERKD